MAKEQKKGAPAAPGKLPKAAIALTTLIASRGEDGKLHGPITAFLQLKADTEALLELDESGGEKFFALQILNELAAGVVAEYEKVWKLLDAIDKGTLTKAGMFAALAKKAEDAKQAAEKAKQPAAPAEPEAAPEQGKEHVDHADVGGTNEGDTPLGGDVPKASL